jgi:5'-deoxynucleotidase YfbR-like HD superfamily hydrolase
MDTQRLERQITFSLEIDKLTGILRRTLLLDGSRHENSAEHSWHISVMAMLLSEYAAESIDVSRVIQMLLIHDLVEIDAGDTYCYDAKANLDKAERELQAAERIFKILPADQARLVRELWDEFEDRQTPESKFANSMDRLQAMMHNYHTQGRQWRKHGVTSQMVLARNAPIAEGSPVLWEYARKLVESALEKGYLDS